MPRPGVILFEALRNAFKKKKSTIIYPFEAGIKPETGLRGTHTLILERCTGCRACERACPPLAIVMVPSEQTKTGKRPVINLGECIFCGEMIIYQKESPLDKKADGEKSEEEKS